MDMTPPTTQPQDNSQSSEQPEVQSRSLTDTKSSPMPLHLVQQDTDLVQSSEGAVYEISNSGEPDSESDTEVDTESDYVSSGVSDYESDEELDCQPEELGYISTESEGELYSDSGETSDNTEFSYESDSEYDTYEDSETEESGSEESESGSEDEHVKAEPTNS
ncbi:hypothetical protein BGX38DRAFT_1283929 [Terfezia claveryi]|nr:hypothetical protein BGX38DRAFT_1283929 [Terfezia claveryi]